MKKSAPFGSWESTVTAEFVAGKDRGLAQTLCADGDELYFLESRPDEGGRMVLMRRNAKGIITAALPDEFNVRTRYLEYGASSFYVNDGEIFFIHFADQQIYQCRLGELPTKLTNDPESRFADITIDRKRNKLIALREKLGKPESENTVCTIDLESGEIHELISGRDFFNSARLNADGTKILWTSWDHPNMAWNGTELWAADITPKGEISGAKCIAGDEDHAVCLPRWQGNDILFAAELDNWTNLYRYRNGAAMNLFPMEAEFAYPDWTPGQEQYGISGNTICAAFQREGRAGFLWIEGGKLKILPLAFSGAASVTAAVNGFFVFVTFPNKPPAIGFINLAGEFSEIYSSYKLQLATEEIAAAKAVQFPTNDGFFGHAWFYEPKNSKFSGRDGEKPPLVVMCHGGPTAISGGEFKKGIQFWTNRGYAVVDVNYGGSTGYGRKYRERLKGNWGKVDVEDCVSVVKFLGEQGLIDPKRVAIRGGSAGGYTTLAALTFTKGVIALGASYFGVSDLQLLAKETHKLESRYMDQLVGPYPEAIEVYKERSPLEHVAQLSCPVIFFQGDEDKIVPPNQSELIYESLKLKGIYSEYHLYAGEGHGFRKAETQQHSLKAEHGFYAKFFDFPVCAQDKV
jgi:dipeptidyl aminopeptidase/acylaminoacyl peptidase